MKPRWVKGIAEHRDHQQASDSYMALYCETVLESSQVISVPFVEMDVKRDVVLIVEGMIVLFVWG